MDTLLTQLRVLIIPGVSLLIKSSTTQSFLGNSTTILWNPAPLGIDKEIREDFESAIKRRGAKHYSTTSVLSYSGFCLSLLCCSRYGLNHTVTPSIPARAYTAAWRGISIVAATAKSETRLWLNAYINLRSAEGYCSSFGMDIAIAETNVSVNNLPLNSASVQQDQVVLASISAENKVVCIDSTSGISDAVDSDSFIPEGQLMSLLVYYENNLR
jgi:hypothetical protein